MHTSLSGTGHDQTSLAKFPIVVPEGTTITFVIEPYGRYQIQSDLQNMENILQHIP